ncbi:MAG: peptide chain release factor N(5)-glutamine methyltransferase [Bacteroidetes bacterium]|nr:peptide chain release factor N(5)-glutamine methyltransferase [Bacteroidota bacterium]
MEKEIKSVKSVIELFNQGLNNRYNAFEIMQFVYILFDHLLGLKKAEVHLALEEILSPETIKRLMAAFEELRRDKPIQYITGVTEFLEIRLTLNEYVLIPRPETEELVELILKDRYQVTNPWVTMLEIGTGSGCIAIALKYYIPQLAITAMDVSVDALSVAKENALINNCLIEFREGNILSPNQMKKLAEFDLIVSNPPYVLESEKAMMQPNVLNYEPSVALFVPDSNPMLFNDAIADLALEHLVQGGMLYLEINDGFGSEIQSLLTRKGLIDVKLFRDIRGKDRFIRAQR